MRKRTRTIEAEPEWGRDEMNLAEFPVALIGKRPPGNVKTIRFTDEVFDRGTGERVSRTLTITGSDLLGLPSQFDDEVLLACVQLSHEQGFRDRKVNFTRYDLLRILGRAPDGRNYQRVAESLDRWAGTLFISDKAWWDKKSKSWVKDSFTLIDRVNLVEKEEGDEELSDGGKRCSTFVWGDFMWRSFQTGNLREIDFAFWKSLREAVSKRLYRLLDKRFYFGSVVRFDLHTLAYDKIGFSRKMHTGQIKEKLRPAHDELQERGVCSGEFVRKERGKWEIVYTQKSRLGNRANDKEGNGSRVDALISRGVSAKKARRLSGQFDGERIDEQIRLFDWHKDQGKPKGPGFLVVGIEEGFRLPDGLTTRLGNGVANAASRSTGASGELKEAMVSGSSDEQDLVATLSEHQQQELEKRALQRHGTLFTKRYDLYRSNEPNKYETMRRYLIESELACVA